MKVVTVDVTDVVCVLVMVEIAVLDSDDVAVLATVDDIELDTVEVAVDVSVVVGEVRLQT